jgi:hypothetical protein
MKTDNRKLKTFLMLIIIHFRLIDRRDVCPTNDYSLSTILKRIKDENYKMERRESISN